MPFGELLGSQVTKLLLCLIQIQSLFNILVSVFFFLTFHIDDDRAVIAFGYCYEILSINFHIIVSHLFYLFLSYLNKNYRSTL